MIRRYSWLCFYLRTNRIKTRDIVFSTFLTIFFHPTQFWKYFSTLYARVHIIRALQQFIISLSIINILLLTVWRISCNKRPAMLHYRSRESSIPRYCAEQERGRWLAGWLASWVTLSSRGKGMTLDATDVNSPHSPFPLLFLPLHKLDRHVSSQCLQLALQRTVVRAQAYYACNIISIVTYDVYSAMICMFTNVTTLLIFFSLIFNNCESWLSRTHTHTLCFDVCVTKASYLFKIY